MPSQPYQGEQKIDTEVMDKAKKTGEKNVDYSLANTMEVALKTERLLCDF